jgi:hypothetical protein
MLCQDLSMSNTLLLLEAAVEEVQTTTTLPAVEVPEVTVPLLQASLLVAELPPNHLWE